MLESPRFSQKRPTCLVDIRVLVHAHIWWVEPKILSKEPYILSKSPTFSQRALHSLIRARRALCTRTRSRMTSRVNTESLCVTWGSYRAPYVLHIESLCVTESQCAIHGVPVCYRVPMCYTWSPTTSSAWAPSETNMWCVWHDAFICVLWHIRVCDMPCWHACTLAPPEPIPKLVCHMYDMTHSYVCYDTFIRVICRVDMRVL